MNYKKLNSSGSDEVFDNYARSLMVDAIKTMAQALYVGNYGGPSTEKMASLPVPERIKAAVSNISSYRSDSPRDTAVHALAQELLLTCHRHGRGDRDLNTDEAALALSLEEVLGKSGVLSPPNSRGRH